MFFYVNFSIAFVFFQDSIPIFFLHTFFFFIFIHLSFVWSSIDQESAYQHITFSLFLVSSPLLLWFIFTIQASYSTEFALCVLLSSRELSKQTPSLLNHPLSHLSISFNSHQYFSSWSFELFHRFVSRRINGCDFKYHIP